MCNVCYIKFINMFNLLLSYKSFIPIFSCKSGLFMLLDLLCKINLYLDIRNVEGIYSRILTQR